MRRWLLRLLLLGLGLVLSAAVLELGTVALLGQQVRFPRHVVGAPFGVRINEPGAVYRHKSPDVEVWFRINAQGMRADRDYPTEKPPGTQRIVSLGDSFTVGYEVAVEDTFSSRLEAELRSRGFPVEVLNAGVSGYSNAEACVYLERELLRYEPDLVLISFYTNDLVDNVRAGLFRLEEGRLVAGRERYVPAGGMGDFLNTNPVFNFLSERSNGFALLKERLTYLMKRRLVAENRANLDAASSGSEAEEQRLETERRLAGAIFERLYQLTRAAGIPLVIQSIPYRFHHPLRLVDRFPRQHFDVEREGIAFLATREVLEPWLERELLYWERSHHHWTPRSHALSGRALAELIGSRGLLGPPGA